MRYATIGTGWITESLIDGAKQLTDMTLQAVYSRTEERAAAFAAKHGAKRWYTDLQAMAEAEDIDAVYIASPNFLHAAHSTLFLSHGKHVLCEKPLTALPREAEALQKLAAEKGLVYMEAIMLLYQPARQLLKEALQKLGRITSAHLDFSQLSSKYPALVRGEVPNIFNPAMSTGCLMDIGVYCVYAALELFGPPQEIRTVAGFLPTGADGWVSSLFQYGDKTVTLSASKVGQSRLGSEIIGDQGTITVGSISQLTGITRYDTKGCAQELVGEEAKATLMGREAAAFARYCAAPDAYAAQRRYADQLALEVARTMEMMRRQAGISFELPQPTGGEAE